MWPFSQIGNFLHGLFDKAGAFISKMWDLAKPFLQEALSKTASEIWKSSQSLFVAAAGYVASQGLPDDDAKRKAFREYMEKQSHDAIVNLKDWEFNLLREMAYAIWKKIQGQ